MVACRSLSRPRNIQVQIRIERQRSSSRSLPRKATRPPARYLPGTTARHGKTLAGPPGKALAKDASGATAKPAPDRDSTTVHIQLLAQPAGRAPAWQHAAPRPTHQAPAWRHADLRGGSTTVPPQLPACLHGAAHITGRGACRSEEERRRTGWASPPSPIKQWDT